MHQFATVQSEAVFDATTKQDQAATAVVEGNSEEIRFGMEHMMEQ